jgi:hypothetical protein
MRHVLVYGLEATRSSKKIVILSCIVDYSSNKSYIRMISKADFYKTFLH